MAQGTYPDDLLYHPEHDWARVDGDIGTFGLTWYAQDTLGEIVFWDAPAVGTKVTQGEAYSELESVKAVSDVIAPLSGTIIEINSALATDPSLVNDSPYNDGWLIQVQLSDRAEREALLDVAAYRGLL